MYARCRARLVQLGADPATQTRLRVLLIDDVRSSTAIVNPNVPGSTKLKLSWIWQTAGGHRLGLAGGMDAIRRVHWLRARAQLNRWQEEVSLTGYEMQWTVRYFSFQSRSWAGVADATGNAGHVTYAKRKRAMWEQLRVKADRIFRLLIDAYKSPF
ncbi:hypothetical protein BYT27DRAFT_7102812 [Phlegmacium glaucopus]|nr:hypothetical protein BYT27DRAFT_7102812 [Phlegmacium glaucopus]